MTEIDHPDNLWRTVIERALDDNESLCLDSPTDRKRLLEVLVPLMTSAERHGYVNGAMDVADYAQDSANAAYGDGFVDGAEGTS